MLFLFLLYPWVPVGLFIQLPMWPQDSDNKAIIFPRWFLSTVQYPIASGSVISIPSRLFVNSGYPSQVKEHCVGEEKELSKWDLRATPSGSGLGLMASFTKIEPSVLIFIWWRWTFFFKAMFLKLWKYISLQKTGAICYLQASWGNFAIAMDSLWSSCSHSLTLNCLVNYCVKAPSSIQ